MANLNDITGTVIGLAFRVYNELGSGFLESVYHKALSFELGEAGVLHCNSKAVKVFYKGIEVGKFFPDIRVGEDLVIELKAIEYLNVIHEVQLVNYLQATGIANGLLINFGPKRVQVKRKYRDRSLPGNMQWREADATYSVSRLL